MARKEVLHEYFDTMILRDVIQRYNVSKPAHCTQLYRRLLSNIAKLDGALSAIRGG